MKYQKQLMIFFYFFFSLAIHAASEEMLPILVDGISQDKTYQNIIKMINDRTSLRLENQFKPLLDIKKDLNQHGLLWMIHHPSLSQFPSFTEDFFKKIVPWIKRGGFLITENKEINQINPLFFSSDKKAPLTWSSVPLHHELFKSFFLLDSLPLCHEGDLWQIGHYDERLAIIISPKGFLDSLSDSAQPEDCPLSSVYLRQKTFINILLVILTTDYKNDQVHVKELLKRVR